MKIFNASRFKMIKGKRIKNYLIYAIGEIILVVIGILIALYINGVQKDNIYEANEQQLLKDVHAQLIQDRDYISEFIKTVEKRNLSYSYFKKDRPKESKLPVIYGLDRSPLKINPMVISIISNFNFKRGPASQRLSSLLTDYNYAQRSIAQLESEMNSIYLDYDKTLSLTYDWYNEFSFEHHINSEATDYFHKNNSYKSFIGRLNRISKFDYIYELKSYKRLMELEISDIEALIR